LRIRVCYQLAIEMRKPDIARDSVKLKRIKNKFRERVGELDALLNVYHFSIHDLKKLLKREEVLDLEVVFYTKNSLH
jgi:hypothetical protein